MPNIRVLIILALQLAVNQLAVVVGLHVDKQDKLLLKRRENVSPLDQVSYFDNLLPIKHASFGNRRQIQGKAAESTEKAMNFLSGSLRSPLNLTLTKSPKFPMDLAYCISCMKPLMLAARAAIVSGNGYERFVNICDRINNLIKCKQRFQMHCKNIKEMEGIMDSLQFLCTKQYKTYESLADCIDAHSAQVVRVCEDECHASKTMVGWFLYGFMHSATPITVQHGEVPSKVHVGYFRKLSSEACKILQCHLLCLKKRYDKKCGGFGGSMMLEALLRPFAPLYDSWLMNPILNTFKLTLPTQCDFIADENEFKSYRLDEEQIQRIQEFIANVPRFPLDNGLRTEPRSRTAPEKLMSLFSQNRHPETEDFIRHPAPIGSELTEDDLHLGDLEEQIMELKMRDQKQRYALAVSNNWNVS